MKEPRLLPTRSPNILVSANKGIGVAMASDICGFNLNEVCTATMHFLSDPECDLLEYMPAPDFSTGGEIIYRREEMERIFNTASAASKFARAGATCPMSASSRCTRFHTPPKPTSSSIAS